MRNEENKHMSISILYTLFTKFLENVKNIKLFEQKSLVLHVSQIYPGLRKHFSILQLRFMSCHLQTLLPLRLMPCHALLAQLSNICIDFITTVYQNILVMIEHHYVEF